MPSDSANPVSTQENEKLLPFAEKDYVDNRRARRILGVSPPALSRMVEMNFIRCMNLGKGSWKRVHYQSIVDYCDHLRSAHGIPDRRPPLAANMRYRDEDLLPFPMHDTVTAQEAARALGFEGLHPVVNRIESGCFEAYQIMPGSNWRVSRSSLMAFIEGLGPSVSR